MYKVESPLFLVLGLLRFLVFGFGVVLFVLLVASLQETPKTAQADLCISCTYGGSTRAKKSRSFHQETHGRVSC